MSADPLAGMFTYAIHSFDNKKWNIWEKEI